MMAEGQENVFWKKITIKNLTAVLLRQLMFVQLLKFASMFVRKRDKSKEKKGPSEHSRKQTQE